MITKNSQAGRLLLYLQSGKKVDRLAALVDLGILELSARLWQLKSHGFVIHKERKTVINRFNEKTSVMEYSLVKVEKAGD